MAIDESLVGMQRLADQPLRHVRAVAVGGVDEVDAQLGDAPQRAQHFRAVGGLAPDAAPGDAHGAEAETVDRDLAANPEGAGRGGVGGLCCVRCFAWHREVLGIAGLQLFPPGFPRAPAVSEGNVVGGVVAARGCINLRSIAPHNGLLAKQSDS